ncbi:unnamed protein product, partial [Brachionus calyciflorus]
LDILNENTNAYLKGHLYKTFIMPVFYYGAEVMIHQKQNINELKRIENNIIRTIYGIPKRCKILLSNEYTKAIIKDLLSINNSEGYISDVLTILNEVTQDGSNNIIENCKLFLKESISDHKTLKTNNQVYNEIHKIFNESNGDRHLIYNLLRYDNPIYQGTNK